MGPELEMKTTAGAHCFAEEKAKRSAAVVDQVSQTSGNFSKFSLIREISCVRKG